MRDDKRIEPLLETVRKIWLEHPDYRLMQLFGNVYRGDPYHMEDDELLQRLESTYLPERDACINAEIPVALEGEISISKVKDLVRKVSDLQAQLRQVEEALQERKEFIADCDTALDRIQAPRTNEGQEELVSTWRRIELLGKLLYQYRQELERSAPTLRAENARFRAVLMNMQAAWNNKNEVTSVYVWNERMKAAMADVDAALQPERGGIQAAHVQACMECGKPVNDHQHLGSSISFHPTRKP